MKVSRHWKTLWPKIQTLENATAAKPRSGALSKLCGRSDRTACALVLAGCCRRRRHRGGWWVEPVNPQPLPLRARPRKRRREDGRNEPGGESRRRRVSGDRGSQPRPDVQEGRPAAAAKLTPEAQARGQRAEHERRGPAPSLPSPASSRARSL